MSSKTDDISCDECRTLSVWSHDVSEKVSSRGIVVNPSEAKSLPFHLQSNLFNTDTKGPDLKVRIVEVAVL